MRRQMVEPGPVQKIEHQHGWMATVYRPLPKTTGRCEDPLGMLTRLERTYAWTLYMARDREGGMGMG